MRKRGEGGKGRERRGREEAKRRGRELKEKRCGGACEEGEGGGVRKRGRLQMEERVRKRERKM